MMKTKPRRNKGIALMVALMLLVLLTVLVGQFTYTSVLEQRVAKNEQSHASNSLGSQGAIHVIEAFLKGYFANSKGVFTLNQKEFLKFTGITSEDGDGPPRRSPGDKHSNPVKIAIRNVGATMNEDDEDDFFQRPSADAGRPSPQNSKIELALDAPPIIIHLREENGKINLNNLLVEERRLETERWIRNISTYLLNYEDFFKENLADDFADQLIALITGDTLATGSGAPQPPQPTPRRSGGKREITPMEEIVTVLSEAKLYKAEGKELATILDGRKADESTGDREVPYGLLDLFTAWGEGLQGKLNVNTCAPELLFALVPERKLVKSQDANVPDKIEDIPLDERKVLFETFLQRRNELPFTDVEKIAEVAGLEKIFETLPPLDAPSTPQNGRNVLFLQNPPTAPTGAGPAQPGQPLTLKQMLTTSSADFRARIIMQDDNITSEFFARIRYNDAGFRLIIWDEVEPRFAPYVGAGSDELEDEY